jgi:very-short-patch-repair endonuclease
LRGGNNLAEAKLWTELKDRRLGGHKFVRQFPVGPFFADFMCREKRLVVEIDGSQHVDNLGDRRRDEYMRSAGISVLRFWNMDAIQKTDEVLNTILAALEGRLAENIVAVDLRFVYAPDTRGAEP